MKTFKKFLLANEEMKDLTNYEKKALLKQLRNTWIYNSNAIEGNTLSQGDTSFIIENGLTVQGKSLAEHNQVIGHMKALDLIYVLLEKDRIEEEDLFLLHKAIQTEYLVDYERPNGAYKVIPNGRWINVDGKDQHFYYPHPDDTQYLMDLWFKEFGDISKPIKSKEEAIKIYTDMHISFAGIHPFHDGNGRLARLVANLPLLKNGYLPVIIDSTDRQEYIYLLFTYNYNSAQLDTETTHLVDNNDNVEYKELLYFFKNEYKNSEELLQTLRDSKKEMEDKRKNKKG